ncbi:uncharacterized protein VICG_01581 [Vittaforma corneae ATCC 50505]|uniref:Uncharacterized protein n=1 Tax=Vittaforma corneae (strain ATCC 50505) TaxID=993615 RepID=L2GKG2_VITCO|nr:uncharacterized protein VICG_01581 [Vittaforma corneae ATCC 50505]ELA41341.1 hypothetical protein VICG_01581 [Vittaforma corneae ATCC 50505]
MRLGGPPTDVDAAEQTSDNEDTASTSSLSNEVGHVEDSCVPELETSHQPRRPAEFKLKGYSDLSVDSIDLYVRRLRLKNPKMSKEEEKAINKIRKDAIKTMNRERRVRRVERKEEYKAKNAKRKRNYFNK